MYSLNPSFNEAETCAEVFVSHTLFSRCAKNIEPILHLYKNDTTKTIKTNSHSLIIILLHKGRSMNKKVFTVPITLQNFYNFPFKKSHIERPKCLALR